MIRLFLFLAVAAWAEQQQPTDTGYRGIWYFNQPSGDQYAYKYSGGFATYPQQQGPIAIYAPKVNRTFFVYGGVNSANSLLHMVSYFDHKTGTVPRPTILLDKKTNDAHDNPVLSIDAEGYLWVFSNSHGVERPSYIHRSRKPYDIAAFDLIRTTNFSYGHVWHEPGKGFLLLHTLYENKGRSMYLSTSSPDGREWANPTLMSRFDLGHYQLTAHAPGRTATAFDYHPDPEGLNSRTNIYYLETRDHGRTWQNVKGEVVSLPVRDKNNIALVKDYKAEGLKVYLKEVAFQPDGNPVMLYLTTTGYESGPKNGLRKWYTARWTGTEWKIQPFTTSDHNYDHGGLWIESNGDWRVIAPTAAGPQPYTTGGDMVLWQSKDQGATWKQLKQLTNSRTVNHTYAKKPVNAHRDFYAFWADGDTLKRGPSQLYFANRDGDVFVLPSVMTGETAKPVRVR
ncbi:hypothetical protein F183_A08300 [Bryobacterales bacterium F-183]|nr:hypothetical protein F183_A08300 [Bryobacterales bacterium F-183]